MIVNFFYNHFLFVFNNEIMTALKKSLINNFCRTYFFDQLLKIWVKTHMSVLGEEFNVFGNSFHYSFYRK